jgi:hypothetical protein
MSEDNRHRGKETRQKILETIGRSEPVGKASGELVGETGLHRDYIRLICNDMVAKGLIVRSGSKFGKYHLASKTLKEDPGLNAYLFSRKVSRDFNRLGNGAICGKSIFCNNNFCKEVFDLAARDENNPKLPVDEIYFFEFALRLGAIIAYQLLQAIRHTQYNHPKHTSTYNYSISNTLKNEYLLKNIQNTMTPLQLSNIFEHWYPIYSRLKPDPECILEVVTNEEEARIVKQQQEKSAFPSILELQDGKFEELELIYKNTFPQLFEDLERIRTVEVPNEIDWQKHSIDEKIRRIKELEKEDPDHSKCGGELLPDIKTNIKGKKVQRCSKCYRWIQIKRKKKYKRNTSQSSH